MLSVDDINKLEAKIEELKAENERLKENYIKLSQQKDLDSVRWVKRCTDLHIEDKSIADKYWLTLQEIKKYCEKCKGCVEVGDEVILYTIIQKIENTIEDKK